MRRLLAGAVIGTMLGLASAGPALARTNQTITIRCVPTGFTYVVDANAFDGQKTANEVYNAVNPLGETCDVVTVG